MPGQGHQCRRILSDEILGEQEAVEIAQTHEMTPNRAAGEAGIVERIEIASNGLLAGHFGRGGIFSAPLVEVFEITTICVNRKRSKAFLDPAKIQISPDQVQQWRGRL